MDNDAAFWRIIRGHRSLRSYAADAVPADIVKKLLEAAHWAPSAHNRQPWHFVLLNEPATRRQLAESMARKWQADLLADGEDPVASRQRADRSVERIVAAPLAILPCLDLDSLDSYPDAQRQKREWQMGVQSVALACQNLLLAAQHYGLATCWMCAPIFCTELVCSNLELPATLEPQSLLTIGYPTADAPGSRERVPLAARIIIR